MQEVDALFNFSAFDISDRFLQPIEDSGAMILFS
jgi:hypothetical protein